MPKIYEYIGFLFFFYSNDHGVSDNFHLHVQKGNKQMKVDLAIRNGILFIGLRKYKKFDVFNPKERAQIEIFIFWKYKAIRKKWEQFFVRHEMPKFEKIKVKIKKESKIKPR